MPDELPDFLKFFAYRLAYTRGLVELIHFQQSAIQDRDIQRLVEVLSHKQSIINEIEQQQQEFPDWRNNWEREREHLAIQTRLQCERLFRETQELLADLLQLEQVHIEQLSEQKSLISSQLDTLTTSMNQQSAYQHDDALAATLLDFSR